MRVVSMTPPVAAVLRAVLAVAFAVTLAACGTPAGELPPDEANRQAARTKAATSATPAQFGGCILTEPTGEVPTDLYAEAAVTRSSEYPPFTKQLDVSGITLVATDETPDASMELVAKTIREVFARTADTDAALQDELVRNLYRYNTVIPVPLGHDGMDFLEDHEEAWQQTESRNSICDIIMVGLDNGQVMEVVEHILHFVSDMGLAYTFPNEWGLQGPSTLRTAMDEAIAQGYYGIDGYDDIDNEEVRDRVLLQEFAYWVISTRPA